MSQAERLAGRVLLIAGGTLYASAQILIALLPAPQPADIESWTAAHQTSIAWMDEALCFACIAFAPAFVLLYRRVKDQHPVSGLIGCCTALLALAAAVVPIAAGGRLAYPIFGLTPSADTSAATVSLLYGSFHTVALVLGAALISFGITQRSASSRWLPGIGMGAGALQILASYPWLVPAWMVILAAVAVVGWSGVTAWRTFHR